MTRFAVLLTLMGLSSLTQAAAEPARMIACDPALVLAPRDIIAHWYPPARRQPGDGIVHPRARIVTLQSVKPMVLVAIDATKADAEEFDVLRFDFSGKGQFADKPVVHLKIIPKDRNGLRAVFGPTTLAAKRGAHTIPVNVKGTHIIGENVHLLTVQVGTALEAVCTFGDKRRTVRLVDGSTDLTCTDKATRAAKPGGLNGHDTVVVYDGDGSLIKGYYGHPILVGDTWYDVTLSADHAKIAVSPTDVEMATLKIAQQGWTARLFGGKHILSLRGSDKPIAIPADRYTFGQFRQLSAPDAKGRTGSFGLTWMGDYRKRGQDDKKFEAVAGKTAEVSVGAPLTARIDASVDGRTVKLTLTVLDVSGTQVNRVVLPDGDWAQPKFRILDENGKVVHSGKLGFT